MSLGTDKLKLNRNLVLSIPMSEGEGTRPIMDMSKNHHAGLVQYGTPTWTKVSVSGQYYLNFVHTHTDYLEMSQANSADLIFGTNPFSGVCWCRITYNATPITHQIFSRFGTNSGWSFYVYDNSHLLRIVTNSPSGQKVTESATGVYTDGVWALLGFTIYGGVANVYKNGADWTATHADHSSGAADSLGVFRVGRYAHSTYGLMNDGLSLGRLWNRALTQLEHMEIFNRERALFGV